MPGGIRNRLTTCVGCKQGFSRKKPALHICSFRTTGFPLDDDEKIWARACGVAYHGTCITAGPPFQTRLENCKGLSLPHWALRPHFVCELCTVRAELHRELERTDKDIHLLMFERMRMIDAMNWWQHRTLKQYGPHLKYLFQFDHYYSVQTLKPSPLRKPPSTPAIPIMWALLNYSLRNNKAGDRIQHNTVRGIKSAASLYYALDLQMAYPRRVMRDGQQRGMVFERVSPTDEAGTTFGTKGMARRMGTETKQSWAISHIHVAYIDQRLNEAFERAPTEAGQHELACAGSTNLMAYFGWLRSGELFQGHKADITLTVPSDGPTRGLPNGVGVVEFDLGLETKSDPCITADVVMAWTSLSGLSVGRWLERLACFESYHEDRLFSTSTKPVWDSRHFREHFVWPLLEQMQREGEPTLKVFSSRPGNRLRDKIYSLHSYRRAGRSRVSRAPRHNEPNPPGTRLATSQEIYEHGRWRSKGKSEDMPSQYNQWDIADRLAISFLCM
jgi:hypothetical protein